MQAALNEAHGFARMANCLAITLANSDRNLVLTKVRAVRVSPAEPIKTNEILMFVSKKIPINVVIRRLKQ